MLIGVVAMGRPGAALSGIAVTSGHSTNPGWSRPRERSPALRHALLVRVGRPRARLGQIAEVAEPNLNVEAVLEADRDASEERMQVIVAAMSGDWVPEGDRLVGMQLIAIGTDEVRETRARIRGERGPEPPPSA
jgi:hypothetical protein